MELLKFQGIPWNFSTGYSDSMEFPWNTVFVRCDRGLNHQSVKGAVGNGTSKFIDFKKNWYLKIPVVPRSSMLWSKSCFCFSIRKIAFLWEKNIIHKQQCAEMCRGVACKPGRQESTIKQAILHADHLPMCLKCRVSAQWFNTAMLPSVHKWCIISAVVCFIYFEFKLNLLLYHANLPKGDVLMTFCASTLTL